MRGAPDLNLWIVEGNDYFRLLSWRASVDGELSNGVRRSASGELFPTSRDPARPMASRRTHSPIDLGVTVDR